ncbi:hypothetical protein A3A60_00245 [Candidatus Curtissbacteria bacterium RIFCSPLOWO2_01_FULL_42_26]|uniref:Methyltransferase type 11 domain-containing protein n=1 Tax=Candidatus Curtissbacteria bacterium RIFCSPLOWO2_01_FULL_42_26 TaxID=1797729 RepID=A0A1F5I2T5_9BACT|nr:MAG: hypothetical protein A3A60_00245 [Candidatus Curtissbacteria bacterium RIFCSPLOWO2_01_FULL_42_26]
MSQKAVSDYYDYMLPFYRFFWHLDAVHYGFWESNTKSFKESLLNTNKFLSEKAGLSKTDFVLDAGCGMGGSSIWIAKTLGAKVVGITLSKKQVEKATSLLKKSSIENLANFSVMDYTKTTFSDETYDVVWAIESVCHTPDKSNFLREAHRILKKGGRVIVGDGFLLREPRNEKERKIVDDFTDGFAIPRENFYKNTIDNFEANMESSGFKKIKYWDKTPAVMHSSHRIYRLCSLFLPIAKVLNKLGLMKNVVVLTNKAGIAQYKAVKLGLGGYAVFYAEK